MTDKTIRLLELASKKRHFYVTKHAEVLCFGGVITSVNGLALGKKLDEGGDGPYTLDEAKSRSADVVIEREQDAADYLKKVSNFYVEIADAEESDFLPFVVPNESKPKKRSGKNV